MGIGWSPISTSGNSAVLVVVLWVSVGVHDRARLRQVESAAGSCKRHPMNAQNTTVEQRMMAVRAWMEMRELCLRCTTRVVVWLVEASRCGGGEAWSHSINCAAGTSDSRAVVVLCTARSVMYCSESNYRAHNTRGDNASVERRTNWQKENMTPCSRRKDIEHSRSERKGATGLQDRC